MDDTKKPENNFSRRPTEPQSNVVELRPEASDGQSVAVEGAPVQATQPQGPIVVDELRIQVYADGNCNITGPFDDRIKYHGLLALAGDTEREMFHEKRRAVAEEKRRREHTLATESRLERWQRERREKAQFEAAKKAAERAQQLQVVKKDELQKALAANATGEPTTK